MLCVVVSIIDFCFHFIIQPVATSGDEFTIEFPGSNNWCKVYHCDALDMASKLKKPGKKLQIGNIYFVVP